MNSRQFVKTKILQTCILMIGESAKHLFKVILYGPIWAKIGFLLTSKE